MSQFDVDSISGSRTDEDAPPPKERKPLFKMPQKKILIITGTVFGVLLIGGIGALAFFGGDDDATTASSSAPPKEGSWAAYAEAVGLSDLSREDWKFIGELVLGVTVIVLFLYLLVKAGINPFKLLEIILGNSD